MFCFIPEKTKHKPVLINAIRCCCTIKFSASLLTGQYTFLADMVSECFFNFWQITFTHEQI